MGAVSSKVDKLSVEESGKLKKHLYLNEKISQEDKIKNVIKKLESSPYFKGMKILKTEENRKKFAEVLTDENKLKKKYLTMNWDDLIETVKIIKFIFLV